MSWRPNSSHEIAQARAAMLKKARDFFSERCVLEVETPALVQRATMDPNIASIKAKIADRNSYLITSPECHMKRLLAAGYPDIYQVCRVFRDGESGRYHLPEFTMVEWYRLAFGLKDIILESTDFVSLLLGGRFSDQQPMSIRYEEAFQQSLGLNPTQASINSIAVGINADSDLRHALGEDRDAWLDLAMANHVATSFSTDRVTVVHHYPASQASLARLCPDDHDLSDRFEIYVGPLEVANGYVELTCADTQQMRFEANLRKRHESRLPTHAIDENLVAALASGLPPCAGVAVGVDRLLMIHENVDHIRDVTTFTPGD